MVTTYFYDTFTEASDTALDSHTPNTGTSWTLLSNGLEETEYLRVGGGDGYLETGYGSGSDHALYTADATYSSADYDVIATCHTPDSSDDPMILGARIQDADNMYILAFNDTFFEIWKCVSGSWTQLGSDAGAVVSANDEVMLRVVGTTISAYVNDVSQISETDSSISAAGKAGVGSGAVGPYGFWDMSLQKISDFTVNEYETTGTNCQLNISDDWKEISAMQINIGDTWKEVAGAQVNIGDAWKEIF